jgi:hypothetical protein
MILGIVLSIIQPVDFVDVFVNLLAERNGFNMKISEALSLWVAYQVLSFSGHELGGQPCAEHLSVEGLPPLVVIVFEGILKLDNCGVGLNTS